ncbi:AraC family transcriptional regulator [Dyella koreensis]|uniref:AraC family transcriptional regulator n=1 Tax=Dyella koreensis TaxID=311235 RepID=A0ABW8K373_9GAMM
MSRRIPAKGLEPIDESRRMADLALLLAPQEGYNLTALPGVRILRSDRALSRTPVLYDPGIVIVCQGRKRGYFGDQVFVYDEQHYLAVAVPVPFTMESDGTPGRPLLAIYMHLDFRMAADLMIQIAHHPSPLAQDAPLSMMSSPMDSALRRSVLRFLEAMSQPLDAAILGPGLLRELYFRVLTGAQGAALRSALGMQGPFGKIGKALRHIHVAYAQPIHLAQLAREADMSVPTFHSHFRSVTRTSPMQYLKSTRLHQARLLMVRQGMTAEAAGYAVGYASASQFNREFKRLFGLPPLAEVRRMREAFAIPPEQAASDYVSSH